MQIRLILLFFSLLTAFTSDAQSSARKTDEYGNLNNENVVLRLDNFVTELMMNPEATGYIITYGGSKGSAATAKAKADFAKNHLVNTRGVNESRLVIIDGGLKAESTTELWIVPFGAQPPAPSPTVKSKPVKIKKAG